MGTIECDTLCLSGDFGHGAKSVEGMIRGLSAMIKTDIIYLGFENTASEYRRVTKGLDIRVHECS
jgi:hypothetical protein